MKLIWGYFFGETSEVGHAWWSLHTFAAQDQGASVRPIPTPNRTAKPRGKTRQEHPLIQPESHMGSHTILYI